MNIVVLDGYTLNPGDLSWDPLCQLGATVSIHDRTPPEAVVDRSRNAEIVLTNKTPLPGNLFAELPKLRYIGVLATGYNVVDVAAASKRGIVVTNVPAYGTRSVAQHAFALLMELTNGVGPISEDAREEWSRASDWCYWRRPLVELDGLTAGLVGRGKIGDAFARLCEAVGMRVISVSSQSSPSEFAALFAASDVVSLHCPLTPATQGIIHRETLSFFKPTAYLINTARGPLIDEPALAEALNSGKLAGAGLDVLSVEPPLPDNPLLTARNCLITPHVAWASVAARRRLMQVAVENVRAFLKHRLQNVVAPGR